MGLLFLFYLLFPIALFVAIVASIVILIRAILAKDTKKIKKMAIVIALLLMPIAYYYTERAIYNSNSTPDINPNPTQKVRIYGKFPLDTKSYYIKASVRYIATNPRCDNNNWLEGVRFAQDEQFDINATMSDNHYKLNNYHDYYKQGVCDWQLGDVSIVTVQRDTNKLTYRVDFSTNKSWTEDFKFGTYLLKAKSPLNFVCNNEYVSSNYTRYFCEDSVQNISAPKTSAGGSHMDIFLPDSQKEFEVNFQYMAEPTQKIKQGEK